MSFFLGPMTKNVTDCIIEYANNYDFPIVLIPSRRQIEYDGGYVNNWKTKDFSEYVRKRDTKKMIKIERDHGGIGQGFIEDDGLESLKEDCKYMDIIHIDPWKKYKIYEDGLKETIKEINYCYELNPNIIFEISTEEGIRPFEVNELEKLVLDLKKGLKSEVYNNIKYLVIQCGTKLLEKKNIGNYDKEKLKSMIELCKKNNLISKEHNGDWVSSKIIKEKFSYGLEGVNIAPEMGEIETQTILNEIQKIENKKQREKLFENFYQICYLSNRWKKWVNEYFVPEDNKEILIKICGHYVLSSPSFQKIKEELFNVDLKIKTNIFNKLDEYRKILNKNSKVLITTSGTGSRLGNLTKYTNKALIKLGDKLAISHIIEKYDKNSEFVITLGYYGNFVKDFLELAYPNYNFKFVWVDNYEGEGSSLGYSLLCAEKELQTPFVYHCCDCILIDEIEITENNCLYVNKRTNSSLYATINKITDTEVMKVNKKGEIKFDYSYIGLAFIKDYRDFWESLKKLYNEDKNNSSLSDVDVYIEMMQKNNTKFNYKVVNNWYDSGNITEVNEVILKTFECKFNVLNKDDESICFFDNYVIKFFYDKKICENRIKRGNLLSSITPIILDYRDNFIKMELIDGILMSTVYENGEIVKLMKWSKEKLWIKNTGTDVNIKELCLEFYKIKTLKRIDQYLQKFKDVKTINNIYIGNIYELINKIDFDRLTNTEKTAYHGDFILENILKCGNEYKLIDWRQDFAGNIEVGDMYYDLSKLRHNIFLNHENIINNLYEIKYKTTDEAVIDLKCNYNLISQIEDYDNFIKENNLDLYKIKILTSLIWINMAPLHHSPFNEFLFLFGKYNLFKLLN